jgi:hypothetical protein
VNLLKRRIVIISLGIMAGLISALFMELAIQANYPTFLLRTAVQGILIGLVFGAILASAHGIFLKNIMFLLNSMLFGGLIGSAAGLAGVVVSQYLFVLFTDNFSPNMMQSFGLVLLRAVSFALLGGILGTIDGLRNRLMRSVFIGLFSGLIGGFISGIIIEELEQNLVSASFSRFLSLPVFGTILTIGFAIAERGGSFGILQVLSGPSRGKEFSLIGLRTSIGSAPKAAISLPDYEMEDIAAFFTVRRAKVTLSAAENTKQLKVNDIPQEERVLKWEDHIDIDGVKFFFKPEGGNA